jgi:hypothetical protein
VPAACTVIARNYVAQARVLARSFCELHEQSDFVAVVIDDDDGSIGAGEPFSVLSPEDLGLDRAEVRRRGAMFGPLGLIGTLRTLLTRHVARENGVALLLDADACVYGDLTVVFALAEERGLVLTPHLPWPLSAAEAGYPLEETFLKFGVFNSGFVAASTKAMPFLDWWCERTARRCIEAPEQGYNYCQHWLTLAVAYFDHHVLRDPDVNVMWWNLYDRDIEWRGDGPWLSGQPLRHFHFTGFDPVRGMLSGRRDEVERAAFPGFKARPGTERLCREYAARVVAAGLHDARRHPLPFVVLPDGTRFSDEARARYRESVEGAEMSGAAEPANPFDYD